MAIDLYGIKTCDTCRKALKSLEKDHSDVTFHDVRATPLSPDQLADFFAAFGDALVNKKSTTWRGLSESDRMTDPLVLLTQHPTLMKRPVINHNGALTLGWTKDVQAAFGVG